MMRFFMAAPVTDALRREGHHAAVALSRKPLN